MFSRRDIFRLVGPLFVEQTLSNLIGIVSTMLVGSIGEIAVSGVSLVESVNLMVLQVFLALATGGAIVTAQYIGRHDNENAKTAGRQLMYVVLAISAGLTVIAFFGSSFVLKGLFGSAEKVVLDNANIYFKILALSYPFIAVYDVGAVLFRVQGNSKISMYVAFAMNVVHISLASLFIFVFKMGIAGAALATLTARIVGAIFFMVSLYSRNNPFSLERFTPIHFEWGMIKRILTLGVPSGLEWILFHTGKIFIQGVVTTFGTAAIAANAVACNIEVFGELPGYAVSLSMVTIIGQCVGAGDYDQAHKYMFKLTGLSIAMLTVFNAGIIIFMNPIIGLFGLTAETAKITWQLGVANAIMDAFVWSMAFILPHALRAAGDVKFTLGISFVCMWLFRVGFSFLLVNITTWGIFSVWIAMYIDWIVRSIAYSIRVLRGKWREIKAI